MMTIPGGFYLSGDGSAHNANGEKLMPVWISNKILDQVRIVDGTIYAPSDDGADKIPAELADVLVVAGVLTAEAAVEVTVKPVSAKTKKASDG